jgi:hypothetical protein
VEHEAETDVLVVGGGVGGVAAALAVARLGRTAILTEETDWIGGQFTSQAVAAPDEHPWIESFGASRSYRAFRDGVRRYYRDHYPLLPETEGEPLNPGRGTVSRLCHEPRVALAVLEGLLAPHRAAGRVRVWTGWRPVQALVLGDRVAAVRLADRGGATRVVHARYVVEATELGDLLPLAGAEHVQGAEAARDTGEPHARDEADPRDVQAFTWCFVLEHRAGEDHTVSRPEGYEAFRAAGYLSWVHPDPRTGAPRRYGLFPGEPGAFPLWTYRRLLDRSLFRPGAFPSDLVLVNWPQNDYVGGSLLDGPEEAARARDEARRLSLSLLHWLQTEAPRPDGGTGWRGLRLVPEAVGTHDGLAMAPYVREARRIVPVFRVTETHLLPQGGRAEAEPFPDAVGIGLYRIDLHPGPRRAGYLDLPCAPFQIPLGALLPVRLEGLLAGGKTCGTTHIANGAFRVHPVEWAVGEAAGALAAFAADRGWSARSVRERPDRLQAFQAVLGRLGVPLAWPRPGPV